MAQAKKNSSRLRGFLIAGVLIFIFIILYFSIRLIFFHKPFLSSIFPGLYSNRIAALVGVGLPGSAVFSAHSSSAQGDITGASDATVTPLIDYDALPIISAIPNLDPNLRFGTFFDTFSGDGFIDSRQTTTYQDKPATAMIFPPDYSWQVITAEINPALIERYKNIFDAMSVNNFNGPYADIRCLAAGCLTQNGNNLSFNGLALTLPAEVDSPDLEAISIASLTTRWLVGFTLRSGQNHRGLVYYFDGTNFIPLKAVPEIISPYFGLYGFGGIDSDFLVIYGGYQGLAYRIRSDTATDIGQFFDMRVMNHGYKAEVSRVENNNDITWYVHSSTLNRPTWFKLWQNGTSEIVGEATFNSFFTPNDASALFKLIDVQSDQITFLAQVKTRKDLGNAMSWHLFVDRGFDNTHSKTVIFEPIAHDGLNTACAIKKIDNSYLGIDAPSQNMAKLWFSEDGQNWQDMPLGTNFNFLSSSLSNFFLKVTLGVSGPVTFDKFYSPFLSLVSFNYYCEK